MASAFNLSQPIRIGVSLFDLSVFEHHRTLTGKKRSLKS